MDLFDEALRTSLRHGVIGEGGTGAGTRGERQAPAAWDGNRTLAQQLMERIASSANLNQAFKRVKANGGAPGVDKMTVAALRPWIAKNRERLIASLLDGSYRPKPVRGVEIPKPGGGMRQLGIPTVVDRLVQQAIAQVLEPILDPLFSPAPQGQPGEKRVAPVWERQFLGYRLRADGWLFIAPKSIARAKERLRKITRRNRGIPLAQMIAEVNAFTTGWVTYFRHIQGYSTLRDLDGWLRRKLRCVRLKQCKRAPPIAKQWRIGVRRMEGGSLGKRLVGGSLKTQPYM